MFDGLSVTELLAVLIVLALVATAAIFAARWLTLLYRSLASQAKPWTRHGLVLLGLALAATLWNLWLRPGSLTEATHAFIASPSYVTFEGTRVEIVDNFLPAALDAQASDAAVATPVARLKRACGDDDYFSEHWMDDALNSSENRIRKSVLYIEFGDKEFVCILHGKSRTEDGVKVHVSDVGAASEAVVSASPDGTPIARTETLHEVTVSRSNVWWNYIFDLMPIAFVTLAGAFLSTAVAMHATGERPGPAAPAPRPIEPTRPD